MEQSLKQMGYEVTSEKVEQMCKKCTDGTVSWQDYLEIVKEVQLQGQKRKSAAVDIKGVGSGEMVHGQGGSGSVYLREEVSVLTRWINISLAKEPTMASRIPINPENDDLFNTCSDGLVLINLLRMIDPNLIDMSKVCEGENLNVFQVRLNLDLALEGCKKIIQVIGIDSQTFLDKTPHLILGILWQLVRNVQARKLTRRFRSQRSLTKKMTVELDSFQKSKEEGESKQGQEGKEQVEASPVGQVTLEPGKAFNQDTILLRGQITLPIIERN